MGPVLQHFEMSLRFSVSLSLRDASINRMNMDGPFIPTSVYDNRTPGLQETLSSFHF